MTAAHADNVHVAARVCGPQGAGHLRLTFNDDGAVLSAIIDDARFRDTTVAACIARKFLSLGVPELVGHPVIVGKPFSL